MRRMVWLTQLFPAIILTPLGLPEGRSGPALPGSGIRRHYGCRERPDSQTRPLVDWTVSHIVFHASMHNPLKSFGCSNPCYPPVPRSYEIDPKILPSTPTIRQSRKAAYASGSSGTP